MTHLKRFTLLVLLISLAFAQSTLAAKGEGAQGQPFQELQAALDAEATARTEADATLQGALDAEAAARAAGDIAGADALAAAIAMLQGALDAEAAARAAGDTAGADAMAAAIAALQAALDAEATARAAGDTAGVEALAEAVAMLQAEITAEQIARESADFNETTARQSADDALQGAIDAENAARKFADEAEVLAREAAISAEAASRILADTEEAVARAAGDAAEEAARIAADEVEALSRAEADSAEVAARAAADAQETADRMAEDQVLSEDIQKNAEAIQLNAEEISAIKKSLQDQIDELVTDTTSLESRIVINEQFIAELQADNILIRADLDSLFAEDVALGEAIDQNWDEIQILVGQHQTNTTKIAYLEGQIIELQGVTGNKQDVLLSQCPEGSAINEILPDGTVTCIAVTVPSSTGFTSVSFQHIRDSISVPESTRYCEYRDIFGTCWDWSEWSAPTGWGYATCPDGWILTGGGLSITDGWEENWGKFGNSQPRTNYSRTWLGGIDRVRGTTGTVSGYAHAVCLKFE